MTRRQAFSRLFGLGAIGAVSADTAIGPRQEPVIAHVAVNGRADREFARLLAREISRGGSLRAEWRHAIK